MPTATIKLSTPSGLETITAIDCGSSTPKLGGTIDVSAFPNLTSIKCISNGITRFQGYGPLTNLVSIEMGDNAFGAAQGNFETLSNKPNLVTINFYATIGLQYNSWTGSFPDLTQNTQLMNVILNNTSLTGNNLDFSMLTKLELLFIQFNLLSGNFPILPTGANSKLIAIHFGSRGGSSSSYTNSTAPLLTDHPNCVGFVYSGNNVTGNIQPIPPRISTFWCDRNFHTGSIPSLAGDLFDLWQFNCQNQRGTTKLSGNIPNLANATKLSLFWCDGNQLTGFATGGSVPSSLGNFQANNNLLTSAAVNAILAAFVAAGRTSTSGTCILNLGGTGNAAPTGQGLTNKTTLISRGWTVTTN
jgi:hypothetical protein